MGEDNSFGFSCGPTCVDQQSILVPNIFNERWLENFGIGGLSQIFENQQFTLVITFDQGVNLEMLTVEMFVLGKTVGAVIMNGQKSLGC